MVIFKVKKNMIHFMYVKKLIIKFLVPLSIQSLYFLNPKIQASLDILCGCTAQIVSDLVGNTEERFSDEAAQIYKFAVNA